MSRLGRAKFTLPMLLVLLLLPLSSASFAVYYGRVGPSELSKLNRFDVLILSPTVDEEYVSSLSQKHTVVGYISLATVGGWEPWAKNVPGDIVIGENREWGEKVVDFSSPKWRSIVLDQAIPYILSRGFDGVFLDNVDYVEVYPEKKRAMVNLIRAIRERYPGIVIIVNRGFSIKDEVAPYIDYVLFEDFVTYYDFSTGKYKIFSESDLEWEFEQVKELQALHVPVLALSYADLDNETQVREFSEVICSYAEKYNVSEVYLADVSLQRIGINPCVETEGQTGKSGDSTVRFETPNEKGGRKICGPAFMLLPVLILPLRRFL